MLLLGGGVWVWEFARPLDGMPAELLVALARLHGGEKILPAGVVTSAGRDELERLRLRAPELFAAATPEQVTTWSRALARTVTWDQAGQECALALAVAPAGAES